MILFASNVVSLPESYGQDMDYKSEAIEMFRQEDYPEAIELMTLAKLQNPDDPEVHYYLGFFLHYQAYDSRPLSGYDFAYSEQIFAHLKKAIELKPDYGDAKYFYGAECSANAFNAMQSRDAERLRFFYDKAFDIGAYPRWLTEFGNNLLDQCDNDAILFTGGNADFDVCSYLQLLEDYRTDITIIPISNIDRPWYVRFLKEGLDGAFKKINVNLTDAQIEDIRPFKWKATTVEIPLSESLIVKYNLPVGQTMTWYVEPDLTSDRSHSKMAGDNPEKRTYLSPQRAMLLHIIEANNWGRPIYFSNLGDDFFLGGLETFRRSFGLVSELMPFETAETDYTLNPTDLENTILNQDHFADFNDVLKNNIPRISGVVRAYYNAVLMLSQSYYASKDKEKLKKLIDFYNHHLLIGFDEQLENQVNNMLGQMVGLTD